MSNSAVDKLVTPRTTLMSISFFAIILNKSNLHQADISLLWTGIDAKYDHIRLGLMVVISSYLISYLMKWYVENNLFSLPKTTKLARYSRDLNGQTKTANDAKRFISDENINNHNLNEHMKLILDYHSSLTTLSNSLREVIDIKNGVEWVQLVIFTWIVPVGISCYALLELYN